MIPKTHLILCAAVVLALVGYAVSVSAKTVAPAVASMPLSHYDGTWLEIARRPMGLTNGCVAGYTRYSPGQTSGEFLIEDGCHKATPGGELKTIHGRGELLDAGGANARLRVHYPFFITWDFLVLYEAPDHKWFITADPKMKKLWIYARAVPATEERAVMVAKAATLGYDVSQLEFPAF